MLLQPNAKLLMTGDSITDAGRKAVREGNPDALGQGYVQMVSALIGATQPKTPVRMVNTGISGNTARDLSKRWQTDVLDHAPDWLSIMIGTNDVWRQFDYPLQTELHVLPEEYTTLLSNLIEQARPKVRGLVLMTPFFIEPNKADPMRARMDQYGSIVKTIAEKYDAIFVDTQAAFDLATQSTHPFTLARDRVHPTPTGHMILALAFLRAVGFTLTT